MIAALLLLLGAQQAQEPATQGGETAGLAAAWARLEAPGPEERRRAWEDLLAAGPRAALEAFEGWEEAAPESRRLRARLVELLGDAESLPGALARVGDEDPAVREPLVRFLGRPALGELAAEQRLVLLGHMAADDLDPAVRAAALRALAGAGLVGAGEILASLVVALPPGERAAAARALLALPEARERAVSLVQRVTRGEQALDTATFALLLEGYGRLLAERGEGGSHPEDAAPLFVGRRHPEAALRQAAVAGFEELVRRLDELGEDERAERVLSSFAAWGWNPREIHYRRAYMALRHGELAQARARAGELLDVSRAGDETEDWTWRFYGLHLAAVVDFAEERFDAAAAGFAQAEDLLRHMLREREDLRPDLHRDRPRRGRFQPEPYPRAPVAGSVAVDRIELVGLEQLWRALALLAQAGDEGPPLAALEALRSAHVALLEAQAFAFLYDTEQGSATWDVLLERDLGPRALLFTGHRLPGWGGARALDLALRLGRALATVTPDEAPGFEAFPVQDPRLRDPFADEERFLLLRRIEDEELRSAQREWLTDRQQRLEQGSQDDPTSRRDPNPKEQRLAMLEQRRREREGRLDQGARAGVTPEELARPVQARPEDSSVRREVYRELLGYRGPTIFALTLAGDLREEGRNAEAEALARGMLEALARGVPGVSSYWTEWTSARLEMSVASSRMDANQPAEAERELLDAVRRLEDLERSLEERLQDARAGGEARPYLRSWIEQARSMLSNALLSLAVNANVRMGDPERALAYFERAYTLDENDFMRVLLACYRARSGRVAEARTVLRSVEPAPPLYYNLACTHALLGDAELALDYLQREFAQNHPTRGSRERQKEWARGDPDLRALRGLPRFERLVAAE